MTEIRDSHSPEVIATAAKYGIRPQAVQTYLDAGRGKRGDGVVRSMHATAKPIGALCNLDCSYCYYLSKEELLKQKTRRMDEGVLERFISQYIATQDGPEVQFTWHGGEPTLLGLDFFRKVVALQDKHRPAGKTIANDIQTNGTLLDDDWCAFLVERGFLVGLSIDGPRDLHDIHRPHKGGQPSFDKVIAGVKLLQKHGVPFSTLTTVNRDNAQQPLRVYRFLRDDLGSRYMQFIPCVEPKAFEGTAPGAHKDAQVAAKSSPRARPGHPMSIVTPWSVDPEDWGKFLIGVFDEWRERDRGVVKVNLFETLLAQLAGKPALICTSSPVCGKNVAIENDGRVYSCDHFVYPEHELGSILEASFAELAFSLPQLEFGLDKHRTLPDECRKCEHLKLCWGECPRTRILTTDSGARLSYLCAGWKRFFGHAVPFLASPRRRLAVVSP
ncbi:MAG TPA: anaerobic sulfatase maturase [Polyangiaceae bacterium]|nr:anaerobic sulfatase maturase [Polyangiaceae bacterium]